jgi:hypothetical protein
MPSVSAAQASMSTSDNCKRNWRTKGKRKLRGKTMVENGKTREN